jgi:tetratricopeptide (TPR) repeat protein
MALNNTIEFIHSISKTITSLMMSLCALFGFGFVSQSFWRATPVIIERIEIPAALEERGYKSEIIVKRVLDELTVYRNIAASNPKGGIEGPENAFFSSMSSEKETRIEASVGGVSLSSLEQAVRHVLQKNPVVVSGEILRTEKDGSVFEGRLRIVNGGASDRIKDSKSEDVNELVKSLALELFVYFDPLRAALAAERLGKRDLALDVLRPLITSGDPDQRKAALWLRAGVGGGPDRDQFLREALSIDPRFFPALIAMSEFETGQRRYAEAIGYADQAIAADPNSPLGYNAKGVALRQSGDRAGGVEQFKKACALPRLTPGCHIWLGLDYMRPSEGKPASRESLRLAYAEFTLAIKANPQAVWAYSHAAYVATELKDFREAKMLALRAVELDKAEPIHQIRLAGALHHLGEKARAKAVLKDALTAFPAVAGPRANQFPGVRQILVLVNEDPPARPATDGTQP